MASCVHELGKRLGAAFRTDSMNAGEICWKRHVMHKRLHHVIRCWESVQGLATNFNNCSLVWMSSGKTCLKHIAMSRRGNDALSYHDDVSKWKHFPRYWPFVRGIHRSPVNPPHKGQWRGALMFSLIYVWINDWVKQLWGWFETLSRPLWRHRNDAGHTSSFQPLLTDSGVSGIGIETSRPMLLNCSLVYLDDMFTRMECPCEFWNDELFVRPKVNVKNYCFKSVRSYGSRI